MLLIPLCKSAMNDLCVRVVWCLWNLELCTHVVVCLSDAREAHTLAGQRVRLQGLSSDHLNGRLGRVEMRWGELSSAEES